jgi:hypothetical protein
MTPTTTSYATTGASASRCNVEVTILNSSNMAIVRNTNGSTDADASDGYTQLVLDIAGYFAQ